MPYYKFDELHQQKANIATWHKFTRFHIYMNGFLYESLIFSTIFISVNSRDNKKNSIESAATKKSVFKEEKEIKA